MDVVVPQSQEIVEVVQSIPQELANRMIEHIVDVLTHHIQEEVVEVIMVVPQERNSEGIFEQINGLFFGGIPHE